MTEQSKRQMNQLEERVSISGDGEVYLPKAIAYRLRSGMIQSAHLDHCHLHLALRLGIHLIGE